MHLKFLLLACCVPALLACATERQVQPALKSFTVVEASIPEMRMALERREVTSHELVRQYLARIATYEDKFHAALTVNANALAEADLLDQERAQGRIRGPLHGIPIAVKDNVQTTNM